jgi:hypothetical protein
MTDDIQLTKYCISSALEKSKWFFLVLLLQVYVFKNIVFDILRGNINWKFFILF